MALSAAVGTAAYSIDSTIKKLDLSEELAEIIRTDNTALISRTGIGHFAASQLTHKWGEDSLNANTAILQGAIAATAGAGSTFAVGSAEGGRFKIGSLLKFNEAGKSEVIEVTAVSTDTLTVTRGYGSTTTETHASGATVMVISHNKQEGWKPTQEDWTKERAAISNFLSTLGYGITLSRERQAVSHAGVPSEYAHQVAYRLKEFMRQLDSAIINSVKSADEGGSGSYHSLGGLIEFVSASGGNTTTTSQAVTPSIINASVAQIWADGGMVAGGRLALICGGAQKRKIAAFDNAYRRLEFSSTSVGYTVEKFLSDLGFTLEIIVDPWMPDDTIIIGDLNRLKIGPLQTDSVSLEELAKTGRTLEGMISGSYTAEIRNALEAWAIISNLTS